MSASHFWVLPSLHFFSPRIGLQAGLIATFILLTWQGLGGGFTANPWTSMISKIIPPDYRGTFFGTQAAVANLFISGAAIAAGYLLKWYEAPFNFAVCFLIAVFFFTVSWIALAFTREPTDNEKVVDEHPTPFWQGASQDPQTRQKLQLVPCVARTLSQFATMGFAFYIVYALRRFQMDEVTAAFSPPRSRSHKPLPTQAWAGSGTRSVTAPCSSSVRALHIKFLPCMGRAFTHMVLPHLHPVGFCQRIHLDERHDHGNHLQQRKGTPVLHRSGANPHRACHHDRPSHRRMDRRHTGLCHHLCVIHDPVHRHDGHFRSSSSKIRAKSTNHDRLPIYAVNFSDHCAQKIHHHSEPRENLSGFSSKEKL
jgi:hypothetical protein